MTIPYPRTNKREGGIADPLAHKGRREPAKKGRCTLVACNEEQISSGPARGQQLSLRNAPCKLCPCFGHIDRKCHGLRDTG